jgi:hypothetical protein
MQQSLKLGGTNYHCKWVKVPGTAPHWKAWSDDMWLAIYKQAYDAESLKHVIFIKERRLLCGIMKIGQPSIFNDKKLKKIY